MPLFRFENRLLLLSVILILATQVKAQVQTVFPSPHQGSITAFSLSANHDYAVTRDSKKVIKLWDVKAGKEIRSFEGTSAHLNKSGTFLAVTTGKNVQVWDFQTGEKKNIIKDSEHTLNRVFISDDGSLLAASGYGFIGIWDIESGVQTHLLTGLEEDEDGSKVYAHRLAISPGNTHVFAAPERDALVKKWEIEDEDIDKRYKNSESFNPAINDAGKKLMVTWDYYTVSVWNVEDDDLEYKLETKSTDFAAVSASGKLLAVAEGNDMSIWDTEKDKLIRKVKISSNFFVFDQEDLIFANGSSLIRWDPTSDAGKRYLGSTATALVSGVNNNRDLIFTFDKAGNGRYFNLTNGQESFFKLGEVDIAEYGMMEEHRMFSPEGSYFLKKNIKKGEPGSTLAYYEKGVDVFHASTGDLYYSIPDVHLNNGINFTADGRYLLTIQSSWSEHIAVWDLQKKQKISEIALNKVGMEEEVSMSDNGAFAAVLDEEFIHIYELTGNQNHKKLLWKKDWYDDYDHKAEFTRFSPSGKYIVSLGTTYASLFNVGTGSEINYFSTGNSSYVDAAFSSDESRMLLANESGNVTVYDIVNDKVLHTLDVADIGRLSGEDVYKGSVAYSGNDRHIVSFFNENRVRLWNAKNFSLTADIYLLDSNDYAIVAPDGRFDGTERGIRHLHYVEDEDLQIIPLESYYEVFYTPNLLSAILTGLPADKPVISMESSQVLPPQVEIISPESGSKIPGIVKVKVQVVDQGTGIDEIRLYLNGKLINNVTRSLGIRQKQEGGQKLEQEFTISPVAGKNELKATAVSLNRVESKPDVIHLFSEQEQAEPELYVLAVGINAYQNPKYNLNYGKADAVAISDLLEQRGAKMFSKVNKLLLSDEQATRENIEKAFTEITSSALAGDVFVFYYAGHGVMSEGEVKDFYLALHDITQLYGNTDLLDTRGISSKELSEWTKNIKAQKQVLIFDACQSGGAVQQIAMRGAAEEKAIMQLARSAGIAVFASTGSDQLAGEFAQLGHGAFTYTLMQALKGGADGSPQDGKVTIREIDAYLHDQLPFVTEKYRGEVQYPMSTLRGHDFPLSLQ